jgi:hypothetical protein
MPIDTASMTRPRWSSVGATGFGPGRLRVRLALGRLWSACFILASLSLAKISHCEKNARMSGSAVIAFDRKSSRPPPVDFEEMPKQFTNFLAQYLFACTIDHPIMPSNQHAVCHE